MRNFIIYLALSLCLFASKLLAQDPNHKGEPAQQTFESRAKAIAEKIENITKEEKATLKEEVEAVNVQFENGSITKAQADTKKKELAEARAVIIENRVAVAQEELKDLVQQKVDGKIKEGKTPDTIVFRWNNHNKWVVKIDKDSMGCSRKRYGEKRTTTQFVFAFGLNNLMTNGSPNNSDFKYWGSHFYEWGLTGNTRLFRTDNLLHLKYGLSLMYNNLRPTDNRVFVVNGNQTNLETFHYDLDDSRFRNLYIAVPVHLEFDFTKPKYNDGDVSFRTHKSFRFGIGGYLGLRTKTKQKLHYELDDKKIEYKEKGNFNVNDFIYGVSTYVGYKEVSLYLKYDINPMFEDNLVKQNNVSLGLRFDLN